MCLGSVVVETDGSMALSEVTHEPICCVVNAELGRNIKVTISEAPLRVPAMISPCQANGSLDAVWERVLPPALVRKVEHVR